MNKLTRIVTSVLLVFSVVALSGCATVVNDAFSRLDLVYQKEYVKAKSQRVRVLETASVLQASEIMRITLSQLGMNVLTSSGQRNTLRAESRAPVPLTSDEWRQVVKEEDLRARLLSLGILYIQDKPDDYIITLEASFRATNGGTLIELDVFVENPTFTEKGLRGLNFAPPHAVTLSSRKLWKLFEQNARRSGYSELRRAISDR